MIDKLNGAPIKVYLGVFGHSIRVEASQLDEVEALLVANNVPHYVFPETLSIDNGPSMGKIMLLRKADPEAVQRLLDANP